MMTRRGRTRESGPRARRARHRARTIVLLAVLAVAVRPLPVLGHFMLSSNIRVIHVEHVEQGLRVYLRLPMPLIVADLVGPARADGTTEPAPYTVNRMENGQLAHYLDGEAVRRDPTGLGQLAAQRHALVADDRLLEGRVESVRAVPAFKQARFATLAEARTALQGPPYAEGVGSTYAGETVVDVQLFYPTLEPVARYYAFGARVSPALTGVESLANVLFDHRTAEPRIFRALGPLATPVVVNRTAAAGDGAQGRSAWWIESLSFTWQGVRHILGGPDHVLFVLCLTIGAAGLSDLLVRVTGFTIGHTITLIAGFLGFAPAAPWFIPAIETAIALSIIYAGAVALLRRTGGGGDTFVVTAAIGLLHGFGFSFVLRNILQVGAPHLWARLLAFNLGVEIGQVGLVLAIWPLLRLTERLAPRYAPYGRIVVVAPCVAVAAVWTLDRLRGLWERMTL